jgi:S1-C subfamily serine protease
MENTKKQLCGLITNTITHLHVFEFDEYIGNGAGVIIRNDGAALTAAHVINNGKPLNEKDFKNFRVFGKFNSGRTVEYKIGICGIVFSNEFIKETEIDLALLIPISKTDTPHLSINSKTLSMGSDVLLGGFPDDLEFPFSVDKIFSDKLNTVKKTIDSVMPVVKSILMIKSGMIGSIAGFELIDERTHEKINGNFIYIDNVMHPGSSGGPIVNYDGELIGIIIQRPLTRFSTERYPELYIPSGATLGITVEPIIKYLR